jgi:hypothetical protein
LELLTSPMRKSLEKNPRKLMVQLLESHWSRLDYHCLWVPI